MKTKKMLLSAAIALSTALTPVAAMAIQSPVFAETVTVSGNHNSQITHSYKAYKIFSGSQGQGQNGILGNIVWGDDVEGQAILNEINNTESDGALAPLKNAKDAADLASKLANATNQDATAKAFAKVVEKHLKTGENIGTSLSTGPEGTNLDAGYYLIVDTTALTDSNDNPVDDVRGLSILQLTGTDDGVVITPKNGLPTPDKEVQDETTEGTQGIYTWGETADHAIGEEFQFKLEAKSFSVADIDAYGSYYLKFVDSFSDGVDYVGMPQVTIKVGNNAAVNIDPLAGDNGGYSLVETKTGERTTGITVEIANIKKFISADQTGNITVTVTYKAKLNKNAVVNGETGVIGNNNDVYLEYSNNPNGEGHGQSEHDKVYVATFKITNTKTDGSNNKLAGAGFKLTRTNGEKKEVAKFDSDNKLTGWDEYSNDSDLTVKGENAKGTEIVSADSTDSKGDFSMTGLDAGTYQLVETTTPAGYNTAQPTTITISATHTEATDGSSATVTIDASSKMNNTVINTQTGSLPETGGMGTTMLYTAGAVLVGGACVLLVTNKRMKRED